MGADLNWWPRGPPEAQEPLVRNSGRNLVREFVMGARDAGLRLITYHYPRCHAYYSKLPAWLSRDSNGKPVNNQRGLGLCVNGPWGDEYVEQVGQLVDFGTDGVYVDEYPLPPTGCFCSSCQALYKNQTGQSMPFPPHTAAEWRSVLQFNTWSAQRFFTRVAERMAERSAAGIAAGNRTDAAVPFFSTHSLPCPINDGERFESFRLVASGDVVSPKQEFDTADSTQCLAPLLDADQGDAEPSYSSSAFDLPHRDAVIVWGWVSGRDAASSRLPHTWFPNSPDGPRYLACAQGGMLAYGLVANPDHKESSIPNATLFNATYSRGARLEAVLAGTLPRRWATVVFPEEQLNRINRFATTGPAAGFGNETAAWAKLMIGAVGVFEQLLVAGAPVGIAADWQLLDEPQPPPPDLHHSCGCSNHNHSHIANIQAPNTVPSALQNGGVRAVILPAGANLTAEQQAGLTAFAAAGEGRTVVDLSPFGPPMAWAKAADRARLGAAVLQAIEAAAGPPPVRLLSNGSNLGLVHGQVLAEPGQEAVRQVFMVSNTFYWCGTRIKQSVPPPATVSDARALVQLAPGAAPSDVRARDVLAEKLLPVRSSGSSPASAVIDLLPLETFAAVELTCTRSAGQPCFL